MRALVVFAGLVACASPGCSEGGTLLDNARYDRSSLSAALDDPTLEAGHVIGTFALSAKAVVDGDTIKVEGLDASLRLLGIDTEETFKHEDELRAYEAQDFPSYLRSMEGSSGRPAKGPTPLGMTAKHFAEAFFRDTTQVRLERDHPKEIRGRYNRYLAYVMVEKDGEWVNYNVECVRAGMSPYFTKYGYSRRFHDEFSRAQEEARQNGVGIWEAGTEHYDDYDTRLAWWNARAEFVAKFEEAAAGKADHIVLTNWDAMTRLEDMRGEWVKVLATVGEVRKRNGRAPARITLSRRLFQDFPVISFDDEIVEQSGLPQVVGEYVVIEGRVSRYTYKSRSRRSRPETQLQIELKSADQVLVSSGWNAVAAALQPDAPSAVPGLPTPRPEGALTLPPADSLPTEPETEPEPEPEPEPESEGDADPTAPVSVPPPPPPL